MTTTRTAMILLASSLLALGACKKKTTEPASDKPASDKPAEDKPMGDKPAADKPAAGGAVEFKKFATDRTTVQDLEKVYPAGTAFTMKALLKSDPTCDTSCTIELTDGDKTYSQFTVAATNKPKLDGKKAGTEVVLSCTPVYEGGMFQFEKSCNLQ